MNQHINPKTVSSLFLCSAFAVIFLFFSCKKETEVIYRAIPVISVDTVEVAVFDTIIQKVPDSATVFILVRHAETLTGQNPNLDSSGQARALELGRILNHVELSAVFSTDFNRTMQTAGPVATNKSLPVENYNATNADSLTDVVLNKYKAGRILVVGHSNTIPQLLNVLVGSNVFPAIPETEYDNLFVVTTFQKGRSEVLHMQYGN